MFLCLLGLGVPVVWGKGVVQMGLCWRVFVGIHQCIAEGAYGMKALPW